MSSPCSEINGTFCSRFLVRVAAQPARAVKLLRADRAMARLDTILELERRLEGMREEISDLLHRLIHDARDQQQLRQTLINLRRDLYHLRRLEPQRLDLLPGPERARATSLAELADRLEAERRAFSRELADETRAVRGRLRRALAENDAFLSSLLLSSRSLYAARQRYLKCSKVRARERQVERGLLRYWTRMVTKATPFAAFCAVLPGQLTDGLPDSGDFLGDPLAIRTSARLNKAFATIIRHTLLDDPLSRRCFLVRLNPTIRRDGEGRLQLLANRAGRETFQRLDHGPALELVQELLERPELRTAADLTRALAAHPAIETSEAQAGAFVDQLAALGMLSLHTGIPPQELRWVEALGAFLETINTETARACRALLDRLAEAANAYADQTSRLAPSRRAVLLDEMQRHFETFQHQRGVSLRVTTPIYEDATADAAVQLARPVLRQAERDLAQWVELTSRISILRRDLYALRHFFETRYTTGRGAGVRVPLLQLYEDYYREHYRDHLDRELGRLPVEGHDLANPFGLDPVRRLLEARAGLRRLLARRWAESEGRDDPEVVLHPDEVAGLLEDVEPIRAHPGWSVEVYAALARPPCGPARLVLRQGSYVTGFGKNLSRFLGLLPDDLRRDVLEQNARFDRAGETGRVLAELADDADFNANLHPPLLAEEISYPIGESRGERPAILPTELEVVLDPDDPGNLWLLHAPTGRRVLPVDTGFMAAHVRPPLYRLLATFNPSPSFTLPLPPGPEPSPATPTRIIRRPRIVFGRSLVLYRAAWLVPAAEYPSCRVGQSERDHLVQVERWRRRHGIPHQVMVRFMPLHSVAVAGPPTASTDPARTDPARTGRAGAEQLAEDHDGDHGIDGLHRSDALKPQLIDFRSPLLVSLLGHMAPPGASHLAVLEERLPDTDQMLCAHGEPIVSELVLRLDIPSRRVV